MSILDLFRKKEARNNRSTLPVKSNTWLSVDTSIPEPTKSLLWITSEDTSKISSPMTIKLTVSLTPDGVDSKLDDGRNFFGEPSLIWTKLPVEKNSEIEKEPMYYPSYSRISPKHRYQYLSWLRDVTQQTNLSYVFLYYYGLERHLLIGNFEQAVEEVLRLLQHHDRGSFASYAQEALIVATLHRKKYDLLEKYPFIQKRMSNEILLLRKVLGQRVEARNLMELASSVGFTNKRCMKLRPVEFEDELQSLLADFEARNGPLLDLVSSDDMEYKETLIFANFSIPESIRCIKIPQILSDRRFKDAVFNLLSTTHVNLKSKK
jgi:hypothetical protein